jgi:3-deoxy-7-phosphoheptulonate synthase
MQSRLKEKKMETNQTNLPLVKKATNTAWKSLGLRENELLIIAGPCSVEEKEMMMLTSTFLKQLRLNFLRGGAYKPRTSPYSFQGQQEKGLEILSEVKKTTGIKIVTELPDESLLDKFLPFVDILQIGARNMQNFSLLKAVGKTQKPIILKRGFGNTIEEWLEAAEYILKEGNPNVILCERGIKTFEPLTRCTLDISSIPVVKSMTKLPVLVDPSHACGRRDLVPALSKASIACGADGLLLEVHQNPLQAYSDGQESIDFPTFKNLIEQIELIHKIK